MELMRERTSDTYRVQEEMMTGKVAPQFNQVPAPYNTVHNHSTIPCNHSIIPHSIIRCLSTMPHEEIELATEVEDEVEEALEEAEDWWYAITVNNQDTMQENVHFHL
jgi:hypothetical protein